MITVSNVSMQFGGSTLFKNVDLKFTGGKNDKTYTERQNV